ncbi:ATP-binding protein, partial [Flavobacterium psychrophilum]
YDAFKQPQDKGVWFVWGGSGSGKSTFVMMLCKEMALLKHKVFFNLLEEETDDTDFIERVDMLEMNDVEDCFLAKTYNYDEMIIYLKRKNSAKVVVIDSATYFFESFEQYQNFKKMFRDKIIIITGHARGNNPKFELEDRIKFDAKMKIFVNGYLALCKGRTIGPNGGRFIIWQEGYDKANGS